MLPVIIQLIRTIRRALGRSARHMSILADAIREAMEDWRKSERKYPFME